MASTTSHLRTALAVLMLFIVTIQAQNEYADRVKGCFDKDKTKFNICLKDLFHEFRHEFAKGIPAQKILPLDPLLVDDVRLEERGPVVDAKATFYNLTIKGAKEFQFGEINFNKNNKSVTATLKIPELNITGKYEMNGTILVLPVNGQGPFSVNLTDLSCFAVGDLIQKNGFLNLEKLSVTFTVVGIKIFLGGLIGNESVDKAVLQMLNDNAHEILDVIKPQLSERVAQIVYNFFGPAFKTLPDIFA